MMYMKCARNYVLRSLTGHVIKFEPDKPAKVPDECIDEALAVNIIPCEGYAPEKGEAAPTVMRIAAMSRELREALLLHGIDEIVRDADSKDFDGGARPKAHALAERTGVEVSASERSKLWDKYRDLKGTNTELPRPKNFDLVVDVQRMTSKKDLVTAAKDLGLKKDDYDGRTIKEIKGMVVQAAIKFESAKIGESVLDEA